jgi:hypothetical protein
MTRVLALAIALFFSSYAFGGADIIGTAGQFNTEAGSRGAVANRQMADQLYQQSLKDEAAAWKGVIPDVGLLSKALHESKEAKAADDQAKEFARAALKANATGAASGDFQSSRYGGTLSETQLRDLATKSSPYESAVQGKLGGYGMKLDADRMSLTTPLGKFPIGMSTDELERTLVGVAKNFGFGGESVSKGIQDAIKTREAIAAKTMAAVDAQLAKSGGADRGPASDGGKAPGTAGTAAEAKNEASATAAEAAAQSSNEPGISELEKRRRALAENKNAIKRQMGMLANENTDPLGGPDQDIFQMVHMKYESLKAEDIFLHDL